VCKIHTAIQLLFTKRETYLMTTFAFTAFSESDLIEHGHIARHAVFTMPGLPTPPSCAMELRSAILARFMPSRFGRSRVQMAKSIDW